MPDSHIQPAPAIPEQVAARSSRLPRWAREPLLHFVLIGAALFGVQAFTDSARRDQFVIRVTPDVRQDIERQYEEQNNRPPTAAELAPLLNAWVRNEVMVREALAMGLDRGDDMIRERILHKMRVLVFGNVDVGQPDPAELRRWFEAHRRIYDTPVRYTFLDLPVDGVDQEARATALMRQIATGEEPPALRTRVHAYVARSQVSMVTAFGAPFVQRLRQMPFAQWTLVQGEDFWHIVRLDGILEAEPASFDQVAGAVALDWEQDQRRLTALRAIDAMYGRYDIRREEGEAGTGRPLGPIVRD